MSKAPASTIGRTATTVNILVTVGTGYIDSHIYKALWCAGIMLITYDSLVSGHEWAVKWSPFERRYSRYGASLAGYCQLQAGRSHPLRRFRRVGSKVCRIVL